MTSANSRSRIRPGPGVGSGSLQRSTDCRAKQSVLILRPGFGLFWPPAGAGSQATSSVPGPRHQGLCQQARPGVACSGAARGPRPQVLGPRPGIACGRLLHVSTPGRAVSKRAGGQVHAIRVSTPRHTGLQPQDGSAPLQSQYLMAITERRLVSRQPSQYPEAHGPSVPRAWLDGALLRRAHPTFKPSRATSVAASGPPGPKSSESLRARGGHPSPSVAGLSPALSQAPSTAPPRPPGNRSRSRPAPPPMGAAALAHTACRRSAGTRWARWAAARRQRPLGHWWPRRARRGRWP